MADAIHIDRLSDEIARGDSPWRRAGVWIASIDYVKQPHVIDAMSSTLWDLVVVDEAHALCGDSARYDAGSQLARQSRHLILLTATPHNGDDARFNRLLDFGARERAAEPLSIFRRTRAQIGLANTRRVRWTVVRLSAQERAVFETFSRFERAMFRAARRPDLSGEPNQAEDNVLLLLSILRKRALSSMRAFSISIARRLNAVTDDGDAKPGWQQLGFDFADGSDSFTAEEFGSLVGASSLAPAQESIWLRLLLRLAGIAATHEVKSSRLVTLLRRTAEPVVVFTEFRDTLDAIAECLESTRMVATIHGGQSLDEQQSAIDGFLAGAASVLAATDVAGQGLNLQSRARWVINFDLPWNPARLEQRAGRVDRIGQRRSVHVSSFVTRHAADRRLLEHIARRTLSARQSLHDQDALGAALPDERVVRRLLFTGHLWPAVKPPARKVEVSRDWIRAGRAACRDLTSRRRLRARWREPRALVRRPLVTYGLTDICSRCDARAILICSVSLRTLAGATVERRIVALRWPGSAISAVALRETWPQIRSAIAASLSARRRRVERWLRARAERLTRAEQQLATAVDGVRKPSQVGLFDRRAARALDQGTAALAVQREDAALRLREINDDAIVEIEAITLEIIWLSTRCSR